MSGSTIRRILDGNLSLRDGGQRQVTVNLIFDSRYPGAIRLVWWHPEPGEWVLARHVLDDGLTRPAGDGAVWVRPSLFGPAPVIRIRLAGTDDSCLIELPADDVAEFLYWAHRLVPRLPQQRHVLELEPWSGGMVLGVG